jgi:hypothetical protein
MRRHSLGSPTRDSAPCPRGASNVIPVGASGAASADMSCFRGRCALIQ